MSQTDVGQWQVPLADVHVSDELVAAAESAVRSGWWSMGARVADFERTFAAYVTAGEALAVDNGRSSW